MKMHFLRLGLTITAISLLSVASSAAASLKKDIKSRLLGAWVVTTIETYSDCGGMYTNNRINGNFVKSSGSHRFEAGELAKVDKIDLNRSRVDVLLSIPEPLLVPYQDGPFTLYNEVACRIELEVELGRNAVKSKDAADVERKLQSVFERHARLEQARESGVWNERERQPYPDDYDLVLKKHAVWQAERTNESIRARIDEAAQETFRVAHRVRSDEDYLAGFAVGVEEARAVRLDDCPALMAVRFARSSRGASGSDVPVQIAEGHRDGRNLVLGLEMARRLPECFVPVPDLPIAGMTAPEVDPALAR